MVLTSQFLGTSTAGETAGVSRAAGDLIGASLNFIVDPTSAEKKQALVSAYEATKPGHIGHLNTYFNRHNNSASAPSTEIRAAAAPAKKMTTTTGR